ncbi:MAG: hypothetical protein OEW15_13465 [Nitrospirota bacterium]|nr:hypothetical protein [Nitrospirota bacterium]
MTYTHPRLIKRPIGRILVDAGLLNDDKLKEALEEQHRTNKLLGEILIAMGAVDRRELDIALSLQSDLADRGKAIRLAAGIRNMLGELFVLAGRITTEQLDGALAQQKRTGEKIGQLLVRLGLTTQAEIDAALDIQKVQAKGADLPTPLRLGELLVSAGHINRPQLEAALIRQKESGRKIGEILVEGGHVDQKAVGWAVRLQGMLLRAVLCAALSLTATAPVPEAEAGTVFSGKIQINAIVLAHAHVNVLSQPQEIVVTDADVQRGYVQVAAASTVEVKNNSPAGCLLSIAAYDLPFRKTTVSVMGRDIALGSNGGLVTLPILGKSVITLSFRFDLASETAPGTYAWPFMLSASPM